jgi:hypothetical protein
VLGTEFKKFDPHLATQSTTAVPEASDQFGMQILRQFHGKIPLFTGNDVACRAVVPRG